MDKRHLVAGIAVALSVLSHSVQADLNIPVVPASVMKDDVPAPMAAGGSPAATSSTMNRDSLLTVKPGENQIVPISMGHLNRVVTPFGDPQVTTTSAATTEVRDNVVYVGTDGEAPVTMFITHKGSEAEAISLTLVPQRIPPRELFVEMEGGARTAGLYGNSKAERWETKQPYVDTVRDLLSAIALGETPQGYTLHEVTGQDPHPGCLQEGLKFRFTGGQVVAGHNLKVNVGVARNVADRPIEFNESNCGDWDVAAVSAWPRNVLNPGESTEIYVVSRNELQKSKPANVRPSLLGGN